MDCIMITRRNIIDQIRRIVYNGVPPDSAMITVNLVALYLNEGIALAAKQAFADSYQIDQVGDVPGAFYMTFSPFTLSHDANTGYYSFGIPKMPLSLPEGKDISNVFIISGSKRKTECSRINTRDLQLMFEVPLDTSEVYYWTEGMTAFLWSKIDITGYTAYIRMPYAEGDSLDDAINCPPDMIPSVIDFTMKAMNIQIHNPNPTQNENIEKSNIIA